MYRIKLTARAKKELKNLKVVYQIAIAAAFEDIKENPFISKPLTRELSGRFSYKMSVFRIIYTVNESDKTVQVLSVGHRSRVYR
ncbi:hypothetical protein COS52_01315 [Candidatus Roizmanbacteria bacterium CG03_land_8_20_14_0_80_39_12]|uniref:Type II toxin-antitoxin system mRNA interferase toxin, RelE/StbE family n=1 Tax=Candidatus Roizmanbacteria bacterium CG03_land_8_20_14_0_80_39_12 TaxID=1974847 RepID=A0A2M7BT92_9BACT|nr:MAG: hypothetical protein COS52_01315 [Candidatus Roizmanbacteria bacterium CG03_land_8_20_14_0_80_39_12]